MSVVTPIADKLLQRGDCPLCAKSDRRTAANSIAIRSPRWRGRAALQNFHAERLRGLEVDDEIV